MIWVARVNASLRTRLGPITPAGSNHMVRQAPGVDLIKEVIEVIFSSGDNKLMNLSWAR